MAHFIFSYAFCREIAASFDFLIELSNTNSLNENSIMP